MIVSQKVLCNIEPADDTGDLSKYGDTLFGNRYVHSWLCATCIFGPTVWSPSSPTRLTFPAPKTAVSCCRRCYTLRNLFIVRVDRSGAALFTVSALPVV